MRYLRIDIEAVALVEHPLLDDAPALRFELSFAAKHQYEFFPHMLEEGVDVDVCGKREDEWLHLLVALLVCEARIVVAECSPPAHRGLSIADMHDRHRILGKALALLQEMS